MEIFCRILIKILIGCGSSIKIIFKNIFFLNFEKLLKNVQKIKTTYHWYLNELGAHKSLGRHFDFNNKIMIFYLF